MPFQSAYPCLQVFDPPLQTAHLARLCSCFQKQYTTPEREKAREGGSHRRNREKDSDQWLLLAGEPRIAHM